MLIDNTLFKHQLKALHIIVKAAMSSQGENGTQDTGVKSKRRRLHGACDLCRQKKIRCDSAKRLGDKCSNCEAFGSKCTHVHINQKIGHGYRAARKCLSSKAPPVSLAELRGSMDPLLKTTLFPTYQAPTNPSIIRETLVNLARYARALEAAIPSEALGDISSVPPIPQTPFSPSASPKPSKAPKPTEDDEVTALAETVQQSLMLTGPGERFFGSSSSVSLLKATIDLSKGSPNSIPCLTEAGLATHMRPQFWTIHSWERPPPLEKPPYEFPEPGLMTDLVEIFFGYVNYYLPLLHRPTFDRDIKAGLHLTDRGFGLTLLGVCALASRYSDDKRVLLEGTDSLHSSGYKWFKQMSFFQESVLRPPSLHEMQAFCLGVMYLQGSSAPERCWYLIGYALRAAQDVGLHRKSKDAAPTVEGELRKRVFYFLLMAESVISAAAGRSPGINPSDYDLDLPIICDDEYWENDDATLAFKQPEGKPSKIAFFNGLLGLVEIHGRAQRAFYTVRSPDRPSGVSPDELDRTTLAELDSALNSWVDSVPDHLRWDPQNTNNVFLDQSAMLFVNFYNTQILVHRPFIISMDSPTLALTSLAICTNAARACSRIMETQSLKGLVPLPQIQIDVFMAGLVLLLGVWHGRRTGFALMNEETEMGAIQSCINVLKTYEDRWHLAGRFRDILMSMLGALPPLDPTLNSSKRNRRTLENDPDHGDTGERTSSRLESVETPIRRLPRHRVSSGGASSLSVMEPHITSPPVEAQPLVRDIPIQFPFYSSDLSKPFFSFNPAADANNPTLQQQLDNFEELIGQAQTGYGSSQVGHAAGLDQIFGFPTSFGVSSSTLSGVPNSNDGIGSMMVPSDFTRPQGPTPEQGILSADGMGMEEAAIWTGLPSDNNWGEWYAYISNMGALSNVQAPFTPHLTVESGGGGAHEPSATSALRLPEDIRHDLPNLDSGNYGW